MVAFINGLKLEEFNCSPEFQIKFVVSKLKKPFAEQAELIKDGIKEKMASN